jgi:hypothetical protein
MPWRPTTILRFERSVPSSSAVLRVVTDQGKGYLKALGNPEGPQILAREWIGTNLAKRFGLSTFEFSIIEVTEADELPFAKGGQALPEVQDERVYGRFPEFEPWLDRARVGELPNELRGIKRDEIMQVVQGVPAVWDGKLLAHHLRQQGELDLGVRQCQRIFRQLGFRRRKPRPLIAKADPEAQARYRKTPPLGAAGGSDALEPG